MSGGKWAPLKLIAIVSLFLGNMGWREKPYHKPPQTKTCDRTLWKPVWQSTQLTTRKYPPLLRHSGATTRRERGMPIAPMQTCLGHSKLETTQGVCGVEDRKEAGACSAGAVALQCASVRPHPQPR